MPAFANRSTGAGVRELGTPSRRREDPPELTRDRVVDVGGREDVDAQPPRVAADACARVELIAATAPYGAAGRSRSPPSPGAPPPRRHRPRAAASARGPAARSPPRARPPLGARRRLRATAPPSRGPRRRGGVRRPQRGARHARARERRIADLALGDGAPPPWPPPPPPLNHGLNKPGSAARARGRPARRRRARGRASARRRARRTPRRAPPILAQYVRSEPLSCAAEAGDVPIEGQLGVQWEQREQQRRQRGLVGVERRRAQVLVHPVLDARRQVEVRPLAQVDEHDARVEGARGRREAGAAQRDVRRVQHGGERVRAVLGGGGRRARSGVRKAARRRSG